MGNRGRGSGCFGCLGQILGLIVIIILIGGCMSTFGSSDSEEPTEESVTEVESQDRDEYVEENNEEYTGGNENIEGDVEETVEKETEPQVEETEVEEQQPQIEPEVDNNQEGHISVTLDRVVDGDTVNIYLDGESVGTRLLLIDTPETVHPQKPVEPFGPEASDRVKQILNNAGNITIEYDEGDKTDHYGRHLVYIYADGVSVQETLLSEGLARVGYIYEQTRYLDKYQQIENTAKQNKMGIWSIDGYVNEGGEGFNSGDKESQDDSTNSSSDESGESSGTTANGGKKYKNCEELRKDFPDGVDSDHPSYDPARDGDKDGWACE